MNRAAEITEIRQTVTSPNGNNNHACSTGKLLLYNGSYQMVFSDSDNSQEFIYTKDGKKLYLKDIAILSFNKDKEERKEKLMSDFDRQKSQYEKWKEHWLEKFNIANKAYELCNAIKKQANDGYQSILSRTGCSSLNDLKEYDKVNGGNNYKQAETYLSQRTDARAGQIRAESDSIFYGRMYVDESKNVSNVEAQKIIAQQMLA